MWWVSKNCPGYDYPRKPEEAVVSPFQAHGLPRSQPLYPAPKGQSLLVKTHSSYKCCLPRWPQGKSTAKQVHADLKQHYEADHTGPPAKPLPYPDLMNILTYKAAYKAACAAAQPEKGDRPDRDPQVCCDVCGCGSRLSQQHNSTPRA